MQALSRVSSIRMMMWLGFGIVLSLFSLMASVAVTRLDSLNAQSDQWRGALNELIPAAESAKQAELSAGMTRIREQLGAPQDNSNSLLFGFWLAGLGSSLGFCWLVTRRLSTPLRQAAATISDIAQGKGDLNRPLDPTRPGELGELASCFNQLTDKIRHLIKQTSRSTESVIEAVAETSDNTSRIIQCILAQDRETEQVATAMTQMTACIHEVARNATTANEATAVAHRETQSGCSQVQKTADTIREGAEEVALAERSIQGVETESQRIGGVLDVIQGIAEQTNLLALNAAIEAARAGEQGRGFAVVADEVRRLATRTHESTGEIQAMIDSLQKGTRQAVSMIATGRHKVDAGAEQAGGTLHALRAISEAMDTISQMSTQIATAAEEQCAVAEEINKSICSISERSKRNAQEAAETEQTTHTLGGLAADLQAVTQQFRLSADKGLDFSAAKSAHLAWRARLRGFLDGKSTLKREEAVSHHDCVLGHWYYEEGLQHFGHMPDMQAIDKPHAEMHQLIKQIIQLKESGQREEAERLYERIAPLSSKIIQLLNRVEEKLEQA
ncbi:MAG: methyl-accepting chemotaxis protein [Candidatus Thiodiazotropha sp.]